MLGLGNTAVPAHAWEYSRTVGADGPVSELLELDGGYDPEFCSEWNPEYAYLGFRCCAKARPAMRGRKKASCAPERRAKWQYCDEMTESQKTYTAQVERGEIKDVLAHLERELKHGIRPQAQCTVNTGFLAWGRRLVPTERNRLRISNPARCTNFGSDSLVALLEWLGREIAQQYPIDQYAATELVVGDMSAPRGGCISGRGGRRGHSSHTSGLDADIGFLTPIRTSHRAPAHFHRGFDPTANWWMLKQMFRNPYACVKVVFLDKKLIRKLEKVAARDPEWAQVRPHLKHVRGHRDHFHVRVGAAPTSKGCPTTIEDDDEEFLAPDDAGETNA